ncbi:MAG: 6-phosphogluconolactonase [Myxococcota bacterium]
MVPNDAALDIANSDVAATAAYRGHRRLTLTYPVINRARSILWVVTGAAKGPVLAPMRRGDPSMPAGRVQRDRALILSDASSNMGAPTS